MQLSSHRIFLSFVALSISAAVVAQPTVSRPDTTRRPTPPPGASIGPKPYRDVITSKAVSDAGMFSVHRVEDKYYFEIPDAML